MSHALDVNRHPVGQRIGYTRVSTVSQTLVSFAMSLGPV